MYVIEIYFLSGVSISWGYTFPISSFSSQIFAFTLCCLFRPYSKLHKIILWWQNSALLVYLNYLKLWCSLSFQWNTCWEWYISTFGFALLSWFWLLVFWFLPCLWYPVCQSIDLVTILWTLSGFALWCCLPAYKALNGLAIAVAERSPSLSWSATFPELQVIC